MLTITKESHVEKGKAEKIRKIIHYTGLCISEFKGLSGARKFPWGT